jgi:hypothetical protein
MHIQPISNVFSFIASGAGLSPLYCGNFWPIVPAPDDRWGWLWSNWWKEDWQGKPKYSEKTCLSATLSTTNPTWTDPGSNPGRRGGNPATNRLSYGAAPYQSKIHLSPTWTISKRFCSVQFSIHSFTSILATWLLHCSLSWQWNAACRRHGVPASLSYFSFLWWEILHDSPSSEIVKYGHEPCGTRNQERLG